MAKLESISNDINALKDSSTKTHSDFETRIRDLEAKSNKGIGGLAALSGLISVLGTIATIIGSSFFQ